MQGGFSSSPHSPDSAPSAAESYSEGVDLLAQRRPADALAAFTRAALLGHAAAHAAAAAIYFEGAVAHDGRVIDGDYIKAFDM